VGAPACWRETKKKDSGSNEEAARSWQNKGPSVYEKGKTTGGGGGGGLKEGGQKRD